MPAISGALSGVGCNKKPIGDPPPEESTKTSDTLRLFSGLDMARYLARSCPRCNGYLGIVLREPGRNVPLQAANGHCLRCGYRMSWIVIRDRKSRSAIGGSRPPCDPMPKKVPGRNIRRRVEIARKSSARRFPSAIANRFLVTTDIVTHFARHLTNSLVL